MDQMWRKYDTKGECQPPQRPPPRFRNTTDLTAWWNQNHTRLYVPRRCGDQLTRSKQDSTSIRSTRGRKHEEARNVLTESRRTERPRQGRRLQPDDVGLTIATLADFEEVRSAVAIGLCAGGARLGLETISGGAVIARLCATIYSQYAEKTIIIIE